MENNDEIFEKIINEKYENLFNIKYKKSEEELLQVITGKDKKYLENIVYKYTEIVDFLYFVLGEDEALIKELQTFEILIDRLNRSELYKISEDTKVTEYLKEKISNILETENFLGIEEEKLKIKEIFEI